MSMVMRKIESAGDRLQIELKRPEKVTVSIFDPAEVISYSGSEIKINLAGSNLKLAYFIYISFQSRLKQDVRK